MEIYKDIEIIDLALYLKKEKTLVLSDLHLGIEESLNKQGVLIPRFQYDDLIQRLKNIFEKTEVEKIILNGDVKHEFGEISNQEWKNILKLFDFLKNKEVIVIKGNHDPVLKPITDKRNVRLVESYIINEISILHGDKILANLGKIIIIGHEHCAVSLKKGIRTEKYSCFLKGKWKNKILIAMPSFNLLTYGTDVIKERLLSPFLTNIENFEIFILEPNENNKPSKALYFGKIKDIKEI